MELTPEPGKRLAKMGSPRTSVLNAPATVGLTWSTTGNYLRSLPIHSDNFRCRLALPTSEAESTHSSSIVPAYSTNFCRSENSCLPQ